MSDTSDSQKQPKEIERLIAIIYKSRTANVINYVIGTILAFVGLMFNVTTAARFVEYTFVAWSIGLSAIIAGALIIAYSEIIRKKTKYIITSWNVRVRKGFMDKSSTRIFYDEISQVKVTTNIENRRVEMGDLAIYTKDKPDQPVMVWEDIPNPDGVREIIMRFINTTSEPTPWSHIDKSQPPVI